MDVLSSMSTVAGYKAVLLATERFGKFFPLLMTAAGTVPPATVLIIGAGVAGLQAIATAKRLGAKVEAFDTRKVVKEQIESLGARFVEMEMPEDAETKGGYAKEMSEEFIKKEMDEFEPNRIALDSLSAMERVLNLRSFREFVISLTSYTKLKEIAGIFTSTTKTLLGGESITEAHISTLTDAILILRYVEMHGEMRRGLTVIKMRGSWHEKEIREFVISEKGVHIGESFTGMEGIMTGMARSVTQIEEEELEKLVR